MRLGLNGRPLPRRHAPRPSRWLVAPRHSTAPLRIPIRSGHPTTPASAGRSSDPPVCTPWPQRAWTRLPTPPRAMRAFREPSSPRTQRGLREPRGSTASSCIQPSRDGPRSRNGSGYPVNRSRAPMSADGCRNFDIARASIWRMRSLVRWKYSPTSSSVRGSPRSRP